MRVEAGRRAKGINLDFIQRYEFVPERWHEKAKYTVKQL